MLDREASVSEFKRRFARDFLDVFVLRILQASPLWGYGIISKIQSDFGVRIGYGVMYPLLKSLERDGLIKSRLEFKGKRKRKVYEITSRGAELVESYYESLREQLHMRDITAAKSL
ncbi:MAG: Transcriptional regulator PadR-like family protein [Candidatus Bathyarchaeota archaeon BA1]|nr:MAG: Transcriptional regulator PadR-like family protein [Candidatus Bathyarchaeota archaeon BA1]